MLATAVSMYLDLNYRIYLLRRLFFRRASQNVVSPGKRSDAPARILLCAHYDAARTGAAFNPKQVARGARLAARLPVPMGPFRILFWSLAILLPILGARMAGLDSTLISFLQLPPTLVLLVGAFLLTDIELSEVVPGRQRQRLRGRDRALARRGARRRAAREPRRLGPADRRRGVPAGGNALLRPRPSRRPRPRDHLLRQRRHGRSRHRPLRDRRRLGHHLRRSIGAWWSCARRSPPPTARTRTATRRVRWSTGFAGDSHAAPHRGLPGDRDHLSQRR